MASKKTGRRASTKKRSSKRSTKSSAAPKPKLPLFVTAGKKQQQIDVRLSYRIYAEADAEADGESPVLEWLTDLNRRDARAATACFARIRLLSALGHELRRPYADTVRNGICELRAKRRRVQYRLLSSMEGPGYWRTRSSDSSSTMHGLQPV